MRLVHLNITDTLLPLNIVAGLVEGENYTSFKLNGTDGKYLRHQGIILDLDDMETSIAKESFAEDATFIHHEDYYYPGN